MPGQNERLNLMNVTIEKARVGANELSIETGAVARQAAGAVVVRSADTVVLVTVTGTRSPRPGMSFFPLTVEYRESAFSAGKIPGGFFKREGRPGEKEILTARCIDRPMRPLFPKGYLNEVQIYAQPLSIDPACDPDVLAITGASAALSISDIPWAGPVAGVRVVRVDGELITNPAKEQTEKADLNLIVVASRDAIVMVEGEANEVPEPEVIEALLFAHDAIIPLIDIQESLVKKVGKDKFEFVPPEHDESFLKIVKKQFANEIETVCTTADKQERNAAAREFKEEVREFFLNDHFDGDEDAYSAAYDDISWAIEKSRKEFVRTRILKDGARIDGRDLTTVRPIDINLGWLPRVHGTSLFTRGETQASVTVTLGTQEDEQKIEDFVMGSHYRRFMLHYNFPPYSVGEARPIRGPGRREIGHGNLAARSVERVVPDFETFPYTIRVVSDITESNGSSSMASVCGASLALMDAGVPITAPIAGVAMGLIQEGDDIAILTDILGDEDHLGDMDFKVTGTEQGVCAIQMDIKIEGLTREVWSRALNQARDARLHVLNEMAKAITASRPELSTFAPRIVSIWVKPDRIRDIIGPGGKMIKSLTEQTGVSINIEDSGRVNIASPDEKACQHAIDLIKALTREVEIGKIYLGTVKSIKEFGAFVEILPGQEGLLHISQLHSDRVERVTDILQEGDEVLVKVLEIDSQGKIRLSRKEAIQEQSARIAEQEQPEIPVEVDEEDEASEATA